MTKRDIYFKAMQLNGHLPLLYIIQQFEIEENYEECQFVLNVIKEYFADYEIESPITFEYYKQRITESYVGKERYFEKVFQWTKEDIQLMYEERIRLN